MKMTTGIYLSPNNHFIHSFKCSHFYQKQSIIVSSANKITIPTQKQTQNTEHNVNLCTLLDDCDQLQQMLNS